MFKTVVDQFSHACKPHEELLGFSWASCFGEHKNSAKRPQLFREIFALDHSTLYANW